MDPRREIFMNVPAARGGPEMSFEETRIQDYLKAYQTTGAPPKPVPEQPEDEAERARLGLPPLFIPYSEILGRPVPMDAPTLRRIRTSRSPSSEGSSSKIQDLTALPEVQVFRPTPLASETGLPQQLQSIVCEEQYSGFSAEELRYRAYWIGKKFAPEAIPNPSRTVPTTTPAALTTPSLSSLTPALGDEILQSISCQPAYSKHSFEELRLAHLRTKHQLTSEQIQQSRVI